MHPSRSHLLAALLAASAIALTGCANESGWNDKFISLATEAGYTCTASVPAAAEVESWTTCGNPDGEVVKFLVFDTEFSMRKLGQTFTESRETIDFGSRWVVIGSDPTTVRNLSGQI